jgi:hypothetical protein
MGLICVNRELKSEVIIFRYFYRLFYQAAIF